MKAMIFIYVSILTDIDRSRVLDLVPERKLEAAKSLLKTLSPAQRTSVKAVAMDRWPAFMSAARDCIPQADIVHDRFHVSKYLGEAVNTVRKQEHRSLAKEGVSPLTGTNKRGSSVIPMDAVPKRSRFVR